MKPIHVLIFLLLASACRSPSHDRPTPDVFANGNEGSVPGVVAPGNESPTQEVVPTKIEGTEKSLERNEGSETIASSSSYGTGVGNGTSIYANVLCGFIHKNGEDYFLHDWNDKSIAHLNVPANLQDEINSNPMRACVANGRLPLADKEILEVDVTRIQATTENQTYEFFVGSLFQILKGCVEEAKTLPLKVLAIPDNAFGESFRVSMTDTTVGLLAKKQCVFMISFAN